MGMKKISLADETTIVNLLRHWPAGKSLTWEELRTFLAHGSAKYSTEIWSRQSLSANNNISKEFIAAKKRIRSRRVAVGAREYSSEEYEKRISALQSALADMTSKYKALEVRHLQLLVNASQLDGGNLLLADPLPDNTAAQRGN